MTLRRIVFYGLLLLVALLPFHAFAVTVLGRAFGWSTADATSPALAYLHAWKEVLLVVLLLCAVVRSIRERAMPVRFVASDLFLAGLLFLALIRFPFGGDTTSWFLGLRTNAEMFVPYFLARSIPWGPAERRILWMTLLASGTLALLFGVLHGLLPEETLVRLGYAPYESSWVPEKPLPLFHTFEGSGVRRWMGSLAGPNQYAAYLLVLLGLAGGALLARGAWSRSIARLLIAAGVLSLLFTGSRGAMLGGLVMLVLALYLVIPSAKKRLLTLGAVIILAVGGLGIFALSAPDAFRASIVRTGSSSEHVTKFREGALVILDHPFGLGLGQAGPVSRRARSAAQGGDDGLVSESWYLQIGQELGIAGLLLMLGLFAVVLRLCFGLARAAREPDLRALAWGTGLAGVGVMVQAIFLHSFADNIAVSLILWALFGIITERSMGYIAPTSTLKSKALHALTSTKQPN